MSIRDKFVYVTTQSQEQTCIGLTEKSGKYHGVVYKYGKVTFPEEIMDEEKLEKRKDLPFKFEYDIIDSNGWKQEDFGEDFFELIGDILVDIIDRQEGDIVEPINRENSSH